jgi:hypothetical protein
MPENGHKVGTGWPSWRYGWVDGLGGKKFVKGQIFQRANDVPTGWTDNPNDLKPAEKTSVVVNKPAKL